MRRAQGVRAGLQGVPGEPALSRGVAGSSDPAARFQETRDKKFDVEYAGRTKRVYIGDKAGFRLSPAWIERTGWEVPSSKGNQVTAKTQ